MLDKSRSRSFHASQCGLDRQSFLPTSCLVEVVSEACRQLQRPHLLICASSNHLLPLATQHEYGLFLGNLHVLESAGDFMLYHLGATGYRLVTLFFEVTENLPTRQAHLGVQARNDRL